MATYGERLHNARRGTLRVCILEKPGTIRRIINMIFRQTANGSIDLREKIIGPKIGDLGLLRRAAAAD